MPQTITVAAFIFGITFLLAAVLGKKVTLLSIEIPPLQGVQRLFIGVLGGCLILFSLSDQSKSLPAPGNTENTQTPPETILPTPLPTEILQSDIPVPASKIEPTATPVSRNITSLAQVSASSVRAEEFTSYGLVRYDPVYAVDANVATAWVEGVDGYGKGQQLVLTFPSEIVLTRIGMDGGFDRDQVIFFQNHRVRSMTLKLSNGHTRSVELADQRGIQYITIDPISTTMITIVIEDVYHGTAYDDTPIAEVEIWGYTLD